MKLNMRQLRSVLLEAANVDHLENLLDVGPSKPMGYLPRAMLEKYGHHVDEVAVMLREMGLVVVDVEEFKPRSIKRRGFGAPTSLFAYDERALQNLMDQNASILDVASWPRDAAGFVEHVIAITVSKKENPDLYALIGKTFNDARFR